MNDDRARKIQAAVGVSSLSLTTVKRVAEEYLKQLRPELEAAVRECRRETYRKHLSVSSGESDRYFAKRLPELLVKDDD